MPNEEIKCIDEEIKEAVAFMQACEVVGAKKGLVNVNLVDLEIHLYTLKQEFKQDVTSTEQDNLFGDSEMVSTHTQLDLPAKSLNGLWESLKYEDGLAQKLLDYIETTMIFSDCQVDTNIISCNRVVLLHGPPGTGKTSLAKALSHKASIRLLNRFPNGGRLVEINAHSLFSKYFSESGKLVTKLFTTLHELIQDKSAFVCILIDEVESLSSARKAALAGSEPSDSIRVVNALLTQLDRLKSEKNVLIITTSNITEAIDVAFVDRADVKAFVGNPGIEARFQILNSCIMEMIRVGLIETGTTDYQNRLADVVRSCHGFSGRSLRKLPFLAHVYFIGHSNVPCSVSSFLTALEKAIQTESIAREAMGH